MNYKALFSDVDGTLVKYDYQALPTEAVVAAIRKASEQLVVCLVTGRAYPFTEPVLKKLHLQSGYVILNNGGQVMDIATKELLYEQAIDLLDAQKIIDTLHEAGIDFYLKQEVFSTAYKEAPFKRGAPLKKAYMFFTEETYSEDLVDRVCKTLSTLPQISVSKSQHKYPDKFGLNIVHVQATKLHGIEIVMKKLGLKKEECIGVGDSYNDFPLLMACGLKVAMGNAVDDLKQIANFVAPPVTQDGIVTLVEEFVLNGRDG